MKNKDENEFEIVCNFVRMLEKSMTKKHPTFGPEFNKILPDRSIIHWICPTV